MTFMTYMVLCYVLIPERGWTLDSATPWLVATEACETLRARESTAANWQGWRVTRKCKVMRGMREARCL